MKSDKSNPNQPVQRPSRGASSDFLLDPLPVPEAVESDSDTAWGLWELSLQGDTVPADEPTQPAGFEQATEPLDLHESVTQHGELMATPDDDEPDHGFQSTVPASLEDLEKLLKR